ncbi:MAG: inner-rane translocator [Conexibacter sp.]|jgi:ribose transport system permease protein|nr:inner-rane translocator [Conexibacter sp.]
MSAALALARGRLSLVTALPFVLLAVLVVLDVSLQPALLSRDQIGIEVATAMSLVLVGLGQTVVILTRGIDLSVGGMMSLTNCLLATRVGSGTGSLLLWCAIILLVGIAGGAVNGLLIGLTRLQPFVVTLATWSIFNGVALWILPSPGGHVPNALISLPLGDWAGIPRMLWILAAVCVLWSLLRRTRTGVQVYAFGSDPDAAFLSGVSTLGVTLRVYAFSGLCAALAGIFVATQTASGSPTVGAPFILNAVAAVVIGGTSLFGGRGGFAGTVAGAFVLTLIAEVTFGLGINSNWGVFAQGLLLILAVAVNTGSELVQRRREERR